MNITIKFGPPKKKHYQLLEEGDNLKIFCDETRPTNVYLLKLEKDKHYKMDFYDTCNREISCSDFLEYVTFLLREGYTFLSPQKMFFYQKYFFDNFSYKILDCGCLLIDKTSIK